MIHWSGLNSIACRIKWGYYVPVVLMAVGFILSAIYLTRVETLVSSLENDFKLLDTVLEIRRFEKNWILYQKKADFETALQLINETQKLLKTISPDVIREKQDSPETSTNPKAILDLLDVYQSVLVKEFGYFQQHDGHKIIDFDKVRRAGQHLLSHVEERSIVVRRSIEEAIRKVKITILVLLVCTFLVALVFGKQLSVFAVTPLKQIVAWTKRVAAGDKDLSSISDKNVDLEEVQSVMTAFRAMLEKLDQREKRIIKSEKLAAVGTLVAGVAHELNNPISNAGTSAQILIEELRESSPLPEKFLREMLEQIVEQTDRARIIVRSLLEFSREKSVNPEIIKMSMILNQTLDLVRGEIPTNVATHLVVEEDGSFLADKQKLQQALVNLLLNAFHALEDREGAAIIVRGFVNHEEGTVRIEIEDNGPGIPPELKIKIFDPFVTTKDVGDGSGLGLAISREIIDKHGGDILVENVENGGARFIICFPLETKVPKGIDI